MVLPDLDGIYKMCIHILYRGEPATINYCTKHNKYSSPCWWKLHLQIKVKYICQMLWHAHLLILPLTHIVESMQLSKASSWQQVAFESTSSKLLSSVLFRNCPMGSRCCLDFDYHLVFCNFILSVGLWRFGRMPQKYSTPSYACPSRSRFLAKKQRCQGRGKKTHTHTQVITTSPRGVNQKKQHTRKPITKKPKKGLRNNNNHNHNRWLRWLRFHPGHLNDTTPMTTINQVSWWHPPGLQTINDVSRHRDGWRLLTLETSPSRPWASNDHGYNSCAICIYIYIFVRRKRTSYVEISVWPQYQCALYIYIYLSFTLSISAW